MLILAANFAAVQSLFAVAFAVKFPFCKRGGRRSLTGYLLFVFVVT
jgi:hypothetical protein